MTKETQSSSDMSQQESTTSIDLAEMLSVLWRSRKFIVAVTGGATILAVIVSLLLPEYFRSTTTLLPETEKTKLAALGGLSDLAAMAGVSAGEVSLARLYPIIIKSEAVLKSVIYAKYTTRRSKEPIDLIQFWGISEKTPERSYESALKKLRDELDVSLDIKTSVVTIGIETTEPQLSADIVNSITSELDKFIRTKRTTNASEQRKWIEARLVEVKQDLERSENDLKQFREKNRRVIDSPQLMLEQERRIRDVQINSTLYTELKKQYEIAKIEEIKNIPIINVMDAGRAAASKTSPRRKVMVIATFLISLVSGVAYVFVAHRYAEDLKDVVSRMRVDLSRR